MRTLEAPLSQLHLLVEKRFWPLFWTQFLGAFNDNVFRNALAILVAYRSMTMLGLGSDKLVVAFPGIFILPFFLFSATAGQLSDRLVKAYMIRGVKVAEVGIMSLAGVGFAIGSLPVLVGVLFLMGLQSTFFGPAKYSILPDLLDDSSLVGGNALVETGTFLAILLGTICAGVLADVNESWTSYVGLVVVAVAMTGLVASLFIRRTPPASPDLKVDLSPIRPIRKILRVATANRTVKLTILGLSWFWFLGAAFLALLPNFTKDVLGGDKPVLTMFLAVFCVGIGVGSLLCERLSHRRLELGLVPLGSIGISLFAADLGIASGRYLALPGAAELLRIPAYFGVANSGRIVVDLFLIAVFSGFYTVPLFTLLQQRPEPAVRSRVIAANNIVNSLFIVSSSASLMGMLAVGVTIPQIFIVLGVLNAAVAVYIYSVIPEFMLRFFAWCVANVMYRIRVSGQEHLPGQGPAVLVANHVSFVDWLLIFSVSARPVRFVMERSFMRPRVLAFLFRDAKVIPIASRDEDPEVLADAYDRIASELEDGQLVCVFPEGAITRDGRMQPFRSGIERIVERTPVPVVPMALVGLWGSFFSRRWGRAMSRPFRRVWSRVSVVIGASVPPEMVTAEVLAEQVAVLGGWPPPEVEAARGSCGIEGG
jgi:1-acyl-sn-glycerol-3-phosphate acyltransferase